MIKLQNISKSFKNEKALDNLSLRVNSGEIYGLLNYLFLSVGTIKQLILISTMII